MRELKFKAWDKVNSKFEFPTCAICPSNNKDYFQIFYDTERYVVMQWTGLADKNGKKIFEGDIVRIKITPRQEDPMIDYDIHQVIFIEGSFCLEFPESHHCIYEYLDELEIIGNIYENPELLNKKEIL